MRKTAFRFLISGITAALALGLTAATASAAVTTPTARSVLASKTCLNGSTACVGHDPAKDGCFVSTTKMVANSYGTVWIRYSSNCNAKWGRGQLTPGSLKLHDSMEVAIGTNDNPESEFMCYPGPSDTGQFKEYCTGNYGGSSIAYTDMVDGSLPATAFVYIFNARGRQIHQLQVSL